MKHKYTFPTFIFAMLTLSPVAGESLPFAKLDDIRGHYDGIGAVGDAFYCHTLGNVGKWPICAYWSSAQTGRSPLLGFGWCIPALESTFTPLDERRWVFHQPDGYARIFVRVARENGNVLTGGPAWTATVRGDTIRVVADPNDGGPKSEFMFSHGRMIRMACEEGEFDISYSKRVAEKISSRGKVLLEISRKDTEGQVVFRFNDSGGKSHMIATIRPTTVFPGSFVEATPLPAQEKCLAQLMSSSGDFVSFDYGGNSDEAYFKANDKTWKWLPRSRRISWHDGWSYTVTEPKNEWDEPSIKRVRKDGKEEHHSYDRKSGLRVQQMPDGSRRECKMFTSGPLAWRRARWVKDIKPDGTCIRTDFAYDEAGRVFYQRTTHEGRSGEKEEVWFNEAGKAIRRKLNDEEVPVK